MNIQSLVLALIIALPLSLHSRGARISSMPGYTGVTAATPAGVTGAVAVRAGVGPYYAGASLAQGGQWASAYGYATPGLATPGLHVIGSTPVAQPYSVPAYYSYGKRY
jgi:hypothetical protein